MEKIKPSRKRLEVAAKKEVLQVKHKKEKKLTIAKSKLKFAVLKKKVVPKVAPAVKPVVKPVQAVKPALKAKPKESYYKFTVTDRKKLQKAMGFKFEKGTTDEEIKGAIGSKSIKDFINGEKAEKGTIGRLFAKKIEMKNGKKVERNMKFSENLNVGDEVHVDLTVNQEANDRLGLKAWLAHQPEIRRVRLTQHGKGRSGLAERASDDNFYFVNEKTGIRSDVYAPIFNTTIKIEQKWTAAEAKQKLAKGYKPDWEHMDYLKISNYDAIEPWRNQAGPIPESQVRSSREILGNSPKAELAKRGITPFIVKMGYRLTPEENAIYNATRKEARRLRKLSIQDRLRIQNERYGIKDGLDLSFKALNLKEEDRAYFYSLASATQYVESGHNPICVNKRRGVIALSTASGITQILNGVWGPTCDKWLRDTKKSRYYRKWYARNTKGDYPINWKMLDEIDFSEQLPGQATPKKHVIFHAIYTFQGSRTYRGMVPIDKVFAMLRSGRLSKEMAYTYKAYTWAMWRNGHGGIRFLLENAKQGIPFPRNRAEARAYFANHMNIPSAKWQKNRGLKDFTRLVLACRKYVNRFDRNLRDQGVAT